MSEQAFGERIRDEREETALLYPNTNAEWGVAAVYVTHRTEGGDYYKKVAHDYGYSNELVRRPYVYYADVHVVDENFQRIETTSVRQSRFRTEERNRARVLKAIEKAFVKAESYAETAGVPVDLVQTHADIHGSWER